jgi:hypothetical protein
VVEQVVLLQVVVQELAGREVLVLRLARRKVAAQVDHLRVALVVKWLVNNVVYMQAGEFELESTPWRRILYFGQMCARASACLASRAGGCNRLLSWVCGHHCSE